MKVPLEWLKEHVTIRLAPKVLADRLTMAGLEVVGIDQGAGSSVFDLEVTPNRADCLSIIGVAREVAAITGQRLKLPVVRGEKSKTDRNASSRVTIRVEDRAGCPRYIGRLIDGVTIQPSPEWMQRRLIACGARPINNVVDVTNYVLLEYGQPLHAFDFARLAEGTIRVRRANMNERIITLDGVSRTLSPDILIIADARTPVAVAGIMGGTGSEVTGQTTTVLLESALFDPVTVRRTGRKLGLASESSYRFERGVDPDGVETASARAASLICELSGGTERDRCDIGAAPSKRPVISLESSRVERWLGMPVSSSTIRTTLARLSCRVATGPGDSFRVSVPSFRRDLQQPVDLYEELARVIGYERVPRHLPTVALFDARTDATTLYWRIQSLRCLCASLGLQEVMTWSLVSEADLTRLGWSAPRAVRLANPLSQDHAFLRPSLLIGLLQAVRRNLTQGATGVRLFEVGSVMHPPASSESLRLGIALSGLWSSDWQTRIPCDFFRLKGLIETVTGRLCEGALHVEPTQEGWAQSGRAASISINGHVVGVAGEAAQTVTHALDLEQGVWVAELSIDALLACARTSKAAMNPSVFPPVKRDISLIVEDHTPFEAIARTIREAGAPLASRVELVDRYTGKQVPQGKHSVTFAIDYRDPAKTLTATEVDIVHQRIGQRLMSEFGATLR